MGKYFKRSDKSEKNVYANDNSKRSINALRFFVYIIKKVATAATRPTTALGDDMTIAPFFKPDAIAEGEGALGVTAAGDVTGLEAEDDPALLIATLRYWGIIKGEVPAALRSTDPLSVITSGLTARKLRVYMTFSATYW